MQPFQCILQPQIQETNRTTHIDTTTRCRTQGRKPHTHTRYLSSLAAATLRRKIQGFVLRLPPQNKARATFTQPLQYVLQHHVANLHLSTHMATPDDNNHAATPMRSATTDSRNAKNYAHRHNHSLQNTEEEPITPGTTPAATTALTRYPLPPAATLYGKTHGFVLWLPPQHESHATFMQQLQCVLQQYCYVMYCHVMYCDVMYCYVMYCYIVMSCIVM